MHKRTAGERERSLYLGGWLVPRASFAAIAVPPRPRPVARLRKSSGPSRICRKLLWAATRRRDSPDKVHVNALNPPLTGFPSPTCHHRRRPNLRCFIAIWPPAAVLDALGDLPRPAIGTLRWSTREQWHVTLRFFGELSSSDVDRACEILDARAASAPGPVAVAGGPGTRFLGPRLIVWPVEGLAQLAATVETSTAALGEPVPSRRFNGHITLARSRGADLRPARHLLHSLAMSWEVSSLSLVRSQLNPKGALYTELARFELPGPTATAPAQ